MNRLLRFGTHQPHRHARGKQASGAADTAPILFSWAPAFALRHSQMSDRSRARATRALSRRARHEYRVSKHRRLTNSSLYAILATDQSSLFVFTRWCAPVHRGIPVFMLTIGRLLPNRPLSRCSFLRSATGAPGFLRRKERSSLIIPCKKQQKQRGAVSGGPVRKVVHPGALLRGRRKGACGSRPFGWHH